MLSRVDAMLHRIEALPGEGRYAVTFHRPDGSEQTAIAQVADAAVTIAEAALPAGWTADGDAARAMADAVQTFDAARKVGHGGAVVLRDVEGGWDVGLGNVVPGGDGTPTCTAHGALADLGGIWECPQCGARARVG